MCPPEGVYVVQTYYGENGEKFTATYGSSGVRSNLPAYDLDSARLKARALMKEGVSPWDIDFEFFEAIHVLTTK